MPLQPFGGAVIRWPRKRVSKLEELVDESRELRQELMVTSIRLRIFSNKLAEEIRKLQEDTDASKR